MDKIDRIIGACAAGGVAAALGCAVGNVWPAAGLLYCSVAWERLYGRV